MRLLSPSPAPIAPGHTSSSPDGGPRATAADTDRTVIESAALLAGAREVLIRHGGECYRLRQTRNDKLILTK